MPRFDEKSIRRARPAVPLRGAVARVRRTSPLVPLVLVVGLLGILAGTLGTYLYQRRGAQPQAEQTRQTGQAADAPQSDKTETAAAAPKEEEEELFRPAAGDLPDVSPPAPEESPRADTAAEAGASVEIRPAGGAAARDESAGAGDEAALRAALSEWVGATNARDVRRQMQFYDSRLDAYYLSRGATSAAVRDEKERVFGRAATVDVRAGAPAIRFSADGRAAAMRFRKSYRIGAASGHTRSGEVVQELRWRKTPQGWRIVSERDVRVLN